MAELTKTDKKQLDNSYEFGINTFWECLEEAKEKDLDTEAVGMEILYQVVQFLGTKGWTEDELLKYMKNANKDAEDNQLYQKELSQVKVAHRKAGELTDKERVEMVREKKILKEGDYADISQEVESVENKIEENNPIDISNKISTEELATA